MNKAFFNISMFFLILNLALTITNFYFGNMLIGVILTFSTLISLKDVITYAR